MGIRPRFFIRAVLIALVVCLGSCVHVDRKSTWDFDFQERFDKSTKEILARSIRAEEIILKDHRASVTPKVESYIQRHFIKANELVQAHFLLLSKILDSNITWNFLNEHARNRAALLKVTLTLQPSLDIFEFEFPKAMSFPSGKIFISRPLAEAFDINNDEFDSVLLGTFIHELIHVRDGHALVQWAMADGRQAWISDKLIGVVSKLSILIPFLSIEYDKQYPLTFGAAKQLTPLSEFAADLGAVSLLDRAGYNSSLYIAFLSESTNANGSTPETPSLLRQRVECLKIFSKSQFDEELQRIVVGSTDDGNKVMQILDLNRYYQLASLLDSPKELAKEFPDQTKATDSELRSMVLAGIRKAAYIGCAIRRTFPEVALDNGALITEPFDLMMFTQH